MEDSNTNPTPLPKNALLSTEHNSTPLTKQEKEMFQSLIGYMRYMDDSTKPQISFATYLLARQTAVPTMYQMSLFKHTLRYLKGTPEQVITYTYKKYPSAVSS